MTESWNDSDSIDDIDREVADLLRLAGPRAEAPAAATRRVMVSVHDSWRRAVAARRRRRVFWLTGCLAGAAAAIFVFVLQTSRDVLVPAGELVLSSGALKRSDGSVVLPGSGLPEGELLTTDPGARASLRLAGGARLRLDAGTRVALKGPFRLGLSRGTIYLESDAASRAGGPLEVETQAGILRDVGTRFEVRAQEGETRVRVRDGSVTLEGPGGPRQVSAGSELLVDAAGRARTGTVPANDPSWGWILDVAPRFDMEGQTLGDFLDWVSSETGLKVSFDPADSVNRARGIVLHGSLGNLRPDLAVDVVLPTCGLDHRVDGDTLVVMQTSQQPSPQSQNQPM
jgi:ferric-dicitrate binding protein FerR (iron transport regulator)